MAIFILSCSNQSSSDEISNVNLEQQRVAPVSGICPPREHLVWELVDTPIKLFKKSGCGGGFGFCFQAGAVWNFSCERNEPIDFGRINFTANNNLVSTIAITDSANKKINFYFSSDVVNSTDNVASDFDNMDIDGILMSDNIRLISGIYNKTVVGNYFVHEIPYENVK